MKGTRVALDGILETLTIDWKPKEIAGEFEGKTYL